MALAQSTASQAADGAQALSQSAAQAASGAEVLAQNAAQAAAAVPSYSWTGYFLGIALMCVMLAFLWFGARLMKQKGALRFFGMTADFNVESRLSLGPKKHLLVVRYQGKRLLLGVSDHNINLLTQEELSEEELAEAKSAAPAEHSTGFTGKFKDILHDLNKRK